MAIVLVLAIWLICWTWFALVGRPSPTPTELVFQQEDATDRKLWTGIDDLQLTRLLKDSAL
jgi:hypothetical protein